MCKYLCIYTYSDLWMKFNKNGFIHMYDPFLSLTSAALGYNMSTFYKLIYDSKMPSQEEARISIH